MKKRKHTKMVSCLALVCIAATVIVYGGIYGYRAGMFEQVLAACEKTVKKIPFPFKTTLNGSKAGLEEVKKITKKLIPTQQAEVVREATKVKDVAEKLNDKGVELILKKKYWQGLYYLQQSIDANGERIEPYLNMTLVLQELGLTRPAVRYFEEAELLNAAHPALQKTYEQLLQKYGDMEVSINDNESHLYSREIPKTTQIIRLWNIDGADDRQLLQSGTDK